MTKKVLILFYSQSGQLRDVVHALGAPLLADPGFDVHYECLQPATPFPFPWPFLQFFDTFPETVHEQPGALLPLSQRVASEDFDLVILSYQVWFLSPAQPIMAFLHSEDAARLLRGKPVITVIACRNMWLMAQETMKRHLQRLGAHLIDNVVLTDPAHSAATFFSTPFWVLTGRKGPFLGGRIPKAGVSAQDIEQAARFGDAIVAHLPQREVTETSSMLSELGAVRINENLIASEQIAIRSFRIWGRLLRALGQPGDLLRRAVLLIYIVFLITMILTVVPLSTLIRRLTAPITRQRSAQKRRYYAAPSGEGCNKVAFLND